ncbi:MAG: hypothetical protein ACI8RD_010419, partial [Bacillariaceae sp.]
TTTIQPSSSSSSFPDIYVHRRTESKKIFPSLYDMFVGGVSLAGESSELTAQREIAEELGLSKALSTSLSSWSNGQPFFTCLVCTGYNRCLVDLFQYVMDTSNEHIVWQDEEVAWGDFVNYNVIMASADLSMQRAASAGTWPGPYPPIQSELEGTIRTVLDDKDDDCMTWKEWDYVPDGLLVWGSWLEFLETSRTKTDNHQKYDTDKSSSSSFVEDNIDSASAATRSSIVSFQVDFGVEEGTNEIITVELSSIEDITPQSQQLAERFNADVNDIQSLLQKSWIEATFIPTYSGPSLPIRSDTDDDHDDRTECIIELPSGLVFELRPSTIGENAGLGLFVRRTSSDNTSDGGVLQTQGSAFCGYGPCEKITDSVADLSDYQRQRSFEFILSDGLESYVWYEGSLLTVWEVMQSSSATGVQAHRLVEITAAAEEEEGKDNFSPSTQLSLIHEGKPCYLIPPAERPDPKSLTIQTIGHMCNDLAGGVPKQTEEEYNTSSHRGNLLVLVPRVVVNDDGILQPSGMPILTLAKTVYIANDLDSMEVGLRYGQAYWKNELS